MYNLDFRDLKLSDLQKHQNSKCYFRTELLPFLNKMANIGGRVAQRQRYELPHYQLIQTALRDLTQMFDSLHLKTYTLSLSPKIKDNMSNILIGDVYDTIPLVQEIVQIYIHTFASVLDVYTLIQIFRKDYSADHVVFLVGEAHSRNFFERLESFRVFWGTPIPKHPHLDITGSFY
jgi:hypothetical protein